MKKKKLIWIISGIASIVVLIGIIIFFVYQGYQNRFVGDWENTDGTLKTTITIDKENNIRFIYSSNTSDTEIKNGYGYGNNKVVGNKLTINYEQSNYMYFYYGMEKDSILYNNFTDMANAFTEEYTKYMTESEIEKAIKIDDTSVTIEITDPKIIEKIYDSLDYEDYEDEDNDSSEESGDSFEESRLILSKDRKSITYKYTDSDGKKNTQTFKKVNTKKQKKTEESSSESKKEKTKSTEETDVETLYLPEKTSSSTTEDDDKWVYELDQFAYYFLILEDQDKREDFIDEWVADDYKSEFKKHLKDKARYQNADLDDIYSDQRLEDDDLYYQLVSVDEKVEYILEKDGDGKITKVLGPNWSKTSKEQIEELEKYIRVRPTMTLRYFVVYYLIETDKEERKDTIETNPEYATENVRKLLLEHVNDDFDDFDSGYWYLSKTTTNEAALIIYNSDEKEKYIITLNSDSELTHVYGENFESLSTEEKNYIEQNKGEKISVF